MSAQPIPSTGPLWDAGRGPFAHVPPLRENLTADVCVVGAGIAGLTTAYLLAERGQKVIVLDAAEPGAGETRRTTAHLASALDDKFVELERLFGAEGSRQAASSHSAAIDWIESFVSRHGIDCDFERLNGYLFAATEKDEKELHEEFEAAKRAGLEVEWLDPGPATLPGRPAAIRFGRQGQFQPMRYLEGLAKAFLNLGGRLFPHSPAREFKDGTPARVTTRDGHTVEAKSVVVATNTPVNDRVTMHTRQHAYRSYAIGLEIPEGAVAPGLYWDTLDPYHYVRLGRSADNRLVLVVGGEDHKTGQDEDEAGHFGKLEQWAREFAPRAGSVVAQWSGQVMEPVDGLALIGPNPGEKNVFIATGDSGHGMTHGTIAGLLLSDLIAGKENPWAKLYDPSRKTLKAAGEYVSENANTAAQYADWLTPGEHRDPATLQPGEGIVLRKGLTKLAVCRDEHGTEHRLSAVCPHLGGLVRWNTAEGTWDCPCHGSRFDAAGKVINGPSLGDLAQAEQEAVASTAEKG